MLKLQNILKNVVFSFLPAIVLFLALEGILRLFHFQYSDMPLEMRAAVGLPPSVTSWADAGGEMVESVLRFNNQGATIRFKKDPYQLWVPVHSFEEKASIQKPAGVLRVASLGCSCTAGCVGTTENESYPTMVGQLLSKESGRPVEVLNAGVGSYSSFQGLQRLKHVVLKYNPDILTIFFGWNDHWFSFIPDSEIKIRSPFQVSLINFFEQFRTYQWLHFLIVKTKGKKIGSHAMSLRVPIDQYEKNLNEIIDLANARNIRVLLITAPADLSNFKEFSEFPFPKERLIPIHQAFNQVVRKVAYIRRVPLVDLEEIVAKEPVDSVLSKDGVHFHEAGCRFVARKIADVFYKEHILEPSSIKSVS